jgi:glutaconate CoA-transferase subunit B
VLSFQGTDVDAVTIADVMASALAREIHDGDLLGVGLGTPLAVMAGLLARKTHAPGAHLLVGGAVDPDTDFATVLGGAAAMQGYTPGYVPHLESMGMAESRQMTMQIMRPAQIDGHGNLNTSRIGERDRPSVRFPGGLATADVPKLLPRLVIYLPAHSPRNLPAQVACVTGSGRGWGHEPRTAGVTVLVTDLAVIDFTPDGAQLRSFHPWSNPDQVAAATGFDLNTGVQPVETEMPSQGERMVLTELDPGSLRAAELRKA